MSSTDASVKVKVESPYMEKKKMVKVLVDQTYR